MKLGLIILFVSMALFAASGHRVPPVQVFNAIGEVWVHWETQTVSRVRSGTYDGPPIPTMGNDATNKVVETVILKYTTYAFRAGTNLLTATITNSVTTVQTWNRKTAKSKWVASK